MVNIGVDVGGTFTDVVVAQNGRLSVIKVPTTPDDQARGVLEGVSAAGAMRSDVHFFAHAMTVATNALLERRGARTAIVTTEGFRDLIEIARQNRPDLYDLTARRPPPLVPRDLRFTVRERVGPRGEIVQPLDRHSLDDVVVRLAAAQVESVAVCLLFAFCRPDHERSVGRAIEQALPGVHVTLSHDILPRFREYERLAATTIDAYLTPLVAGYLHRLEARCQQEGLPAPIIMQSSGGSASLREAARHALPLLLSGPAAGVVGAAWSGRRSGWRNLLTCDMGGTSCDVSVVVNGQPGLSLDASVGGLPLGLPVADVHTVGAGGGSIAWVDAGGALRVGPASTGAVPGPACYGLGGDRATVTDANVVLGYIRRERNLAGIRIHPDRASAVMEEVGTILGMDACHAAGAIRAVAHATMARAIRRVSLERGHDPRDFALLAFGGAGPLHACSLATELGIRTVLIPAAAGALSALGLLAAQPRRDEVQGHVQPLRALDPEMLRGLWGHLHRRATSHLPGAAVEYALDLRYHGQSHEITVDALPTDSTGTLIDRFERAYAERFGTRMPGHSIDVVAIRAAAALPPPALQAEPPAPALHAIKTTLWVQNERRSAPVLVGGGPPPGDGLDGPAIIEMADTTILVEPGWRATRDSTGTTVLEHVTEG